MHFGIFLAFAASVYFHHKVAREDRPRSGVTKSKLETIDQLAHKLRTELNSLEPDADHLLWLPERRIGSRPITDDVTQTEFGLTVIRQEIDERTYRLRYLERNEILEAIDVLGNYARHGASRLPEDEGSRPRTSDALWIWMTNAHAFWVQILGRPFRRGIHQQEGITPASQFFIAAIKPLAPDTKASAIDNAMGRLIRQERNRAGTSKSRLVKNPPEKS
jgi:hypothetical protein